MSPLDKKNINILLVEDNPGDARIFIELMSQNSNSIKHVTSLKDTFEEINNRSYDIVLLDLGLPDSKGPDTFLNFKSHNDEIPVIIFTGNNDEELGKKLITLGAQDYLVKGFVDDVILIKSIHYAIDRRKAQRDLDKTNAEFKNMITKSPDGMVVTDMQGKILYLNHSAEFLLGKSINEMRGEEFEAVLSKDDLTQISVVSEDNENLTLQLNVFEATWENKPAKIAVLRNITELIKNQQQVVNLNDLLKTIGNINHLIVTEKDPHKLLEKACKFLINGRSYATAWIGLYDDTNKIIPIAQCGINDEFEILKQYLNNGQELFCECELSINKNIVLLDKTLKLCGDCPLAKLHPSQSSIAVKINHDNQPIGILAVSRDVEYPFKKEEESLLLEVAADLGLAIYTIQMQKKEVKSQEELLWLHRALEEAANAIVLTDTEGTIEWVNPAFSKLTGYSQEEAIGNTPRLLHSGKHDKEFYKNLWDTILRGEIWRGEIENKKKDGSIYPEEMTITPVTDKLGKMTKFIAIKSDITELKESEERYRSIYENAPIGIFRTDMTGKVIMVNPALSKMLNYSLEEVKERFSAEQIYNNPEDRKHFLDKLLKDDIVHDFETVFITKEGNEVDVRINAKLIRSKNEITIEGVVEDITTQKELQRKLLFAKEEAEKSEKFKGEFLAQMSHEIRTPLNAILSGVSFVESELESYDNSDIKETIQIMNSSGSRIIRTIESILNMSELQAGTYEVIRSEFDLVSEIIHPTIENYKGVLKDKNIILNFDAQNDQLLVNLDRYSTFQIFTNIFDNAVKYTKKGTINVNLIAESKVLTIEVIDTGIGISNEYIELIFNPFSQESQGYSRPYDGCGLGLTLCQRYVELNNGTLSIQSETGKGTSVKVVFQDCLA